MKIIHIITRLIIGGAQENTLLCVEGLAKRFGDQVTLITGPADGPEGDLLPVARAKGVDICVIPELVRPIAPMTDYRAYRKLKKLIGELSPDVVHTHSSKAGILGRAAARGQARAIVHTIHGLPFHPYERWWKNAAYVRAERMAAGWTDRILCVADAMTANAVAAGIAPEEKFITIHSGMEIEPFLSPPRDRASVRGELGLNENDLVVGKVARLFELKGHEDVIAAAKRLAPRWPNLRFLFVGGGTWRERLEQAIAASGLQSKFLFTGLVPPERIPELLSACDVVVHASFREGLARVLPQALLAARPVVSYDVDGAREVVLPGRTGFLVHPGDITGLSDSIARLLFDPELRKCFGATGRSLFVEQFRHQSMTEKIRGVYREILCDDKTFIKGSGQ